MPNIIAANDSVIKEENKKSMRNLIGHLNESNAEFYPEK
jgi:hypothetical protein